MSDEYLMVMTTTDSSEAAGELAKGIVEVRLAACVQVVGPIQSTFWWEGAVESDEEWLCLIKTRTERFDALREHIEERHSYDTPEITAAPLTTGSRDYLSWITTETQLR